MVQDFQIIDINNNQQNGLSTQFMYKGFLISASKILRSKVIAYDENDNIIRQGDTIEQVLVKLDRMLDSLN